MERFDRLQSQVDNLEARVRSYEVGGTVASAWTETASEVKDPAIEKELEKLKDRVRGHAEETAADETVAES